MHSKIVGIPSFTRDPDAHIYVNIGIHGGCLFSQRDAYIHREFGHPDAHIHVDMGIGVRIFA